MPTKELSPALVTLLNTLVPHSRAFHYTGQDRLKGNVHTWEDQERYSADRIDADITAAGILITFASDAPKGKTTPKDEA
jgi:hypothetical protein